MRFRWILPTLLGTVGALCLALPAEAARLQFWRFNERANRLVFTTDVGIQPRAQLIANPTRLVIDLPDVTLGRQMVNQVVGGAIKEVRIGQFDAQTTRIVIEFNPGYNIDPKQIEIQGSTPRQWLVQLPTPQRLDGDVPASPPTSIIERGPGGTSADTELESIRATADGFFIRTRGKIPQLQMQMQDDRDRRQLSIDLSNTIVSSNLKVEDLPVNRYGVSRWQIAQVQASPPITRITLDLVENSPDWRASVSSIGGVILLPQGGLPDDLIADPGPQPVPRPAPVQPAPPPTQPVPIQPPTQPSPPTRSQPGPLPEIPRGQVVVVIDPGHGGIDPGAVGIGGLQEKRVIFPISLEVASLLEAQGVRVVLTRRSDITLDLEPRVNIAEQAGADLFVSIHANAISLSRPDVNGVETYYFSEAGRRLARTVHNSLLQATGLGNRGVKSSRFFVLRNTSAPAILIEVGFVTGAQDAPKLAQPAFRSLLAEAIARGLLQHIRQNF
ncbi:MAG: AMIN domain-containing protein [Cyanothece sp. SIO1E1]|nr:AMIN domain-containing protein [Cyanothece sp. SIO1E1]